MCIRDRCGVMRLNIQGMMCTKSCTPTVEAALRAVPGVENVTVNLDGACAFVMGTAPPEQLIAAVEGAGGNGKVSAQLFGEAPEAAVTRLNIEGMMCTQSCTPTVTAALEAVEGVVSVNVALDAKAAWVKGSADPELLVAAVNSAGGCGKFRAVVWTE
eukprot:TRINITY_DN7636_c0_g1_i1.p3 TRINITY_DN7636_c0_g1~~TRINITY_DN7636_c0_g1_i1.p3  ORF type:complete len:158 (-),score=55.64 TRINITY_DN7636_c0_g1_i1:150-623(-)